MTPVRCARGGDTRRRPATAHGGGSHRRGDSAATGWVCGGAPRRRDGIEAAAGAQTVARVGLLLRRDGREWDGHHAAPRRKQRDKTNLTHAQAHTQLLASFSHFPPPTFGPILGTIFSEFSLQRSRRTSAAPASCCARVAVFRGGVRSAPVSACASPRLFRLRRSRATRRRPSSRLPRLSRRGASAAVFFPSFVATRWRRRLRSATRLGHRRRPTSSLHSTPWLTSV